MSTPIPTPGNTTSGSPLPGPRPTGDPDRIRSDVDRLLGRLNGVVGSNTAEVISGRTHLLEQAHEVLTEALTTVDRV
ncbi:hypothetical protein ABH922_002239 [Rhodococcus sp. 27YEA15]|uniref:hypothetical protein n=1 Tax=Rhodococcus sp. 27YEA15 TaxID=3156259 RepID=UPI003C7E30F4